MLVGSSVADVGGDLSDDRLRFVPAASVSLEEYAAGFTASFVGYHFNLTLDAARLARKIRVEQHDLQHSLIAYEGDELVGVAALAIRGEAGWVGGFGVVPRRRGRGLGRLLMAALLGQARACRLRRLTLEVLAQNAAARRLYEGAGMRVTRDLLILARAAASGEEAGAVGGDPSRVEESDSSNTDSLNADSSNSGRSKSDSSGRSESSSGWLKSDSSTSDSLKEAAPAELLSHFARLHAEPPAWQRDVPSLLTGRARGFYLGERARPRAYALTSESLDGNTYISDLAAADAASARELSAALGRVACVLRVVNEPEHSPFVGLLLAHGFAETERQHEMTLEL